MDLRLLFFYFFFFDEIGVGGGVGPKKKRLKLMQYYCPLVKGMRVINYYSAIVNLVLIN